MGMKTQEQQVNPLLLFVMLPVFDIDVIYFAIVSLLIWSQNIMHSPCASLIFFINP